MISLCVAQLSPNQLMHLGQPSQNLAKSLVIAAKLIMDAPEREVWEKS